MFKPDPGYKGGAKGEVKETFIGNGEENEDRGESEEDDDETVEIVVVWLQGMQEGHCEGCDCCKFVSKDETRLGKGGHLLRTTQPTT